MRRYLLRFPKFTGPARAYFNYYFGEKEILFLQKFLKNEKNFNFFDIGANYGIYTFLFGKKADKVFVFEPIEECINYIKLGYKKNNIVYINKIVSDTNQKKLIKIPIYDNQKIFGKSSVDNQFAKSEKRELQALSLDEFIKEANFDRELLGILKIDCEGHELNIIKGAKNFLKNSKLLLLIEIEKRHNPKFLNVFMELINLNYDVFIFKNKNLQELENINEIETIMKNENNFLFKNF